MHICTSTFLRQTTIITFFASTYKATQSFVYTKNDLPFSLKKKKNDLPYSHIDLYIIHM